MNKDKLINYAEAKLHTEKTAHDIGHSMRVMEISRYIGKQCDEDVDMDVIEVAAIVHDVIDRKVAPDVAVAVRDLKKELLTSGFSEVQRDHIMAIIQNMSYSSGRIPDSLEGKIVQDADRLEAVGAIAIARTFAYGGSQNRLIYDEDDEACSIAHFYDKLLKLKGMMNTEVGSRLAEERHQFMETYLAQFFKEWQLEDLQ